MQEAPVAPSGPVFSSWGERPSTRLQLAIDPRTTDPFGLTQRLAQAFEQGDGPMVVALLERICCAVPDFANGYEVLGHALVDLGRREEGIAALRRSLELAPKREVLQKLAEIVMPGPSYYDHLRWIHEIRRPRSYIEIGLWSGGTFRLATPPTRAIGIDPEPRLDVTTLPDESRVFVMTSDRFFEPDHAARVLADFPIDFAFIDGLHLFEQALKDFINVEAHCAPQAVITLHDALPPAAIAGQRESPISFCCGDVWKIVPCLEKYRPDLRIELLPAYPSGLTVVSRLDPSSTVLRDRFDEIVAEFIDLPLSVMEAMASRVVGVRENSRDALLRALG